MIKLSDFNDDFFTIEHLSDSIILDIFRCTKGYGLECYLKYSALNDEMSKMSRTYIIKTTDTNDIVAYFTLRSGLLTVSRGWLKGFDAYTGIELANFAVNDMYKEANNVIPKLGSYIFYQFILPLVNQIVEYLGAAYLYIFALPNNKLISHYKTMGFTKGDKQMSKFIYSHVKPTYDQGCVFMYQKL